MKTFEEAMRLVCRPVESPAQAKSELAEMSDDLGRYQSTASTIMESPDSHRIVAAFLNSSDVESAALSLFITGVVIGMEMQRQELPE